MAGQRPTRIAVNAEVTSAKTTRRPIERELRELGHRCRSGRDEGVDRGPRHHESSHARQHREDEAFDQCLANEPPAIRANRGAHGELTLAIRGSGQQQARDVRASEQQHEHDSTEEHTQRIADGPGKMVAERNDRRGHCTERVRVFASELLRDDRELGLGTVDVDARRESCHNTPVAGAPVCELWILQRSRNPDLLLSQATEDGRVKPFREHPDDFERLPFEHGLAADDVRISAEHPLPGAMADHRDVRRELGVFARRRTAARESVGRRAPRRNPR